MDVDRPKLPANRNCHRLSCCITIAIRGLIVMHSTFLRSAKNDLFAHFSAAVCKKVIFGAAWKRAVRNRE